MYHGVFLSRTHFVTAAGALNIGKIGAILFYPQEVKSYVENLHTAGKNFSQIVVILAVQKGYSQHVAQRMVEAILDFEGNGYRMVQSTSQTCANIPDIDTSDEQLILNLSDKEVGLSFEQFSPRVVLLENFLSEEECDKICEIATVHLKVATVLDRGHEEGVLLKEVRDCDVVGLLPMHSTEIGVVERRIEELTGWPQNFGEPLQVQRYRKGGKFDPHYDFFLENTSYYENETKSGGQRVATMIIYLKQPEAGGATYFANLGIRIIPRKGSAVFFSYPNANSQSGTLHAGAPIISGEKWIMTKWFREGNFMLEEHYSEGVD